MSFPSEHFYDGRLSVGSDLQTEPSLLLDLWPAGNDEPIAFVHIEGVEQTLTVATDEGSEKSKSNYDEVLLVVGQFIGDVVYNRFRVKCSFVALRIVQWVKEQMLNADKTQTYTHF